MSRLYQRIVRMSEIPKHQCEGTGCWVWRGFTWRGYGRMNVRMRGKLAQLRAHRAALVLSELDGEEDYFPELYIAYSVARFETDHLCENPPCVNPDHLQWLEPKQHYAVTRERRQARNA